MKLRILTTSERSFRTKYRMILKFRRLYLLIALFSCTSLLFAQRPILDPTFGTNGTVTTPIVNDPVSGARGYAFATKVQSDGKIVIAGLSKDNTSNEDTFVLGRFNTNGTLDNTFGSNGGTVRTLIGSTSYAYALAIQSDGKIIAAGTALTITYNTAFALARYNTDGTLDNSFGANGIVVTENVTGSDGTDNEIYAIALQTDGKIVVAGYSWLSTGTQGYALARYNTDGTLDTSFGTDGTVTDDSGLDSEAWSLVIQSDGKIVLGGDMDSKSMLARYNENGTLDATGFGTDGVVNTTLVSGEDYSIHKSIAIQPDGKIVAASTVIYNSYMNSEFAVTRYNTDGSLDISSFANPTGINAFTISGGDGTTDDPNAMCLQDNGKIIVVGSTKTIDGYGFAIARLNTDGSLDNTFGTNGSTFSYIAGGNNSGSAYGVALQSDGKIVAAGYTQTDDVNLNIQPALARWIPDSYIYVKATATGLNNGTSWANAYTSLQSALNAAVSGDQIWVAKGTYKPSSAYSLTNTPRYYHFELKNGVGVYGGFAGTETSVGQRTNFGVGQTNETVLSGDLSGNDVFDVLSGGYQGSTGNDNCYHVIYNLSTTPAIDNSAVLDGFTISGGNASETSYPHADGGGIYCENASPTINNTTIKNNFAYAYGGAAFIYSNSCSPVMKNITLLNNLANEGGGGIWIMEANLTITNGLFLFNRNNVAGGAIYNTNATISLKNVTIANNYAKYNGGGIYNENNATTNLYNCILWSNSTMNGMAKNISNSATLNLHYSCFGNGANDISGSVNDIIANIHSDPLFKDISNVDFRLFGNSPCVNTGNNSYNKLSNDIRGQARIQNTTIDMGAYEWTSGVDPAINTFTLDYTADAHGSITGTASQTVNYGTNGTAVTAVPNTGYHFVNWSDASTSNPRTDLNVTANIAVNANFAINNYSISASVSPVNSGTIAGATNYNHGDNVTLAASPNTGYTFTNWTESGTQVSSNATYSFTATANRTLVANFELSTSIKENISNLNIKVYPNPLTLPKKT